MQDLNASQQFNLQLNTDLGGLNQILQEFERVAAPLLTEEQYWQSQVALAEGFTNAVRHAHRDLPRATVIEVKVKIFPDCLEIEIWDWGQPFDLYAKLGELDGNDEEDPLIKEGGRGLFFMRQLTDELSYTRSADERNCLLMRKRLLARSRSSEQKEN